MHQNLKSCVKEFSKQTREKGVSSAVYHLWKVVLDTGKQIGELFLQELPWVTEFRVTDLVAVELCTVSFVQHSVLCMLVFILNWSLVFNWMQFLPPPALLMCVASRFQQHCLDTPI